jgi:hypothetical protein
MVPRASDSELFGSATARIIVANRMPLFARKTVPIYGFIGLVRLSVNTNDEDSELLGYARELHRKLEAEIDVQVQQTLGPEFEVISVEINRGSITLLIALGAVGTFYMGFSRYEGFVKSVNLLVSQLRGLLQRFFGQAPGGATRPPVSVTGCESDFRCLLGNRLLPNCIGVSPAQSRGIAWRAHLARHTSPAIILRGKPSDMSTIVPVVGSQKKASTGGVVDR